MPYYQTVKDIHYRPVGTNNRFTIPKGTYVTPADNLPGGGLFWAEPWEGMTEAEESWEANYGFLVQRDEVEEFDPIS